MSRQIVVGTFDLELSAARRGQAGGPTRRWWPIFQSATSPVRAERWQSLTAFVTDRAGLDMSLHDFEKVIGADANRAFAELGSGDHRYWDWREKLTALRVEYAAEGRARNAEAGRPVAVKPATKAAKSQVTANPNGVRIIDAGQQAEAVMQRLRRDDPAAVERVARGESTAHFEAVRRGWRSPSISLGAPETVAARLAERYDDDDLAALVSALTGDRPEATTLAVRLGAAAAVGDDALHEAVTRERGDGVTWRRIAEELGVSERTARSRYS